MAANARIHKVTGVVSFKQFHLDAPGLVGQEEAEDKKQALVAVGETEPHVMVIRPGITCHWHWTLLYNNQTCTPRSAAGTRCPHPHSRITLFQKS